MGRVIESAFHAVDDCTADQDQSKIGAAVTEGGEVGTDDCAAFKTNASLLLLQWKLVALTRFPHVDDGRTCVTFEDSIGNRSTRD